MDPQIGSDIAKLLGNLGKSTGSSSNAAASSDAGTAFKRALAASRQAQAEQTSGNELPVQPSGSEAPQQRGSGSVAVTERGNSIAAQAPSDQVATVAWPGFDLQLVGSPSQQLDVLKFAREVGLSEEVLAQLFPQNGATSVDLKATSKELAEAVATAINEWVTAAVKQPITSDAAVSRVDSPSSELDTGKLAALIAPSLIAMAPDAKAFPDAISRQLAADLQPALQNWISHLSPTLGDPSPPALADAIAPTVTRWLSGEAASSQ